MFMYAMTVYSASLILVGCSYKMILHYYLEQDEVDDQEAHHKDHADHRRDIACLFSRSMAVSFLALDLMIMSHRGLSANFARLNQPMPILVSLVVYALLFLTLWLPSITTNLPTLSMLGCGIVLTQLIIRTRGLRYFPVSKRAMNAAAALRA